jgi:hypothetical protein
MLGAAGAIQSATVVHFRLPKLPASIAMYAKMVAKLKESIVARTFLILRRPIHLDILVISNSFTF